MAIHGQMALSSPVEMKVPVCFGQANIVTKTVSKLSQWQVRLVGLIVLNKKINKRNPVFKKVPSV